MGVWGLVEEVKWKKQAVFVPLIHSMPVFNRFLLFHGLRSHAARGTDHLVTAMHDRPSTSCSARNTRPGQAPTSTKLYIKDLNTTVSTIFSLLPPLTFLLLYCFCLLLRPLTLWLGRMIWSCCCCPVQPPQTGQTKPVFSLFVHSYTVEAGTKGGGGSTRSGRSGNGRNDKQFAGDWLCPRL